MNFTERKNIFGVSNFRWGTPSLIKGERYEEVDFGCGAMFEHRLFVGGSA
jgi:hypothetical protein